MLLLTDALDGLLRPGDLRCGRINGIRLRTTTRSANFVSVVS